MPAHHLRHIYSKPEWKSWQIMLHFVEFFYEIRNQCIKKKWFCIFLKNRKLNVLPCPLWIEIILPCLQVLYPNILEKNFPVRVTRCSNIALQTNARYFSLSKNRRKEDRTCKGTHVSWLPFSFPPLTLIKLVK